MRWRLLVAAAAVAGGAVLANRRRQKAEADAALWAEATDPVTRFGD